MRAGLPSEAMLPDRIVGVLCLVIAGVVATWGGPVGGPSTTPPERSTARRASSGAAAPDPETTTTTVAAVTTTAPAATSSTTTTAPPSTTTTAGPRTAAAAAADEAEARRILLTTGDLPPGFVVVRQPSGEAAGNDGPFERCLGPDAGALTAAVRAKARSAEFGRSGTGTVSSSSAVFDSPESAAKVISILASPPARACFEGLINARLARNPNLPEDARGTLTGVDPGQFADQTTGFRFEVRLPAEDLEEEPTEEEIPYLADFVFVRKGRSLVLLEFGSLRRPFPADDLRRVAGDLARRM